MEYCSLGFMGDTMDDDLFGFIISNDTQFDIANKRLMRFVTSPHERTIVMGAVSLNDVMVRFLLCLLNNRLQGNYQVARRTLFKEVWEDYGLVASSQQLWKTIRNLKVKLASIGLPQDFIISDSGECYSIGDYIATPLFYRQIPSFSK